MLKLRKCCKCGAIDNFFDDTVEDKYSVTADTCEKCGFGFEYYVKTEMETFGPYDTIEEANKGSRRLKAKGVKVLGILEEFEQEE